MRFLISGFEAFAGEAVNPTEELVAWLKGQPPAAGIEISAICLPVTFAAAFEDLRAEFRRFRPDVVLALGLAGGRSAALELERVAINCIDSEIADNAGVIAHGQPIEPTGPAARFSTLPLRGLVSALNTEGITAKISNSAGTYVCNFLFYRLQELSAMSTCRTGFVHLPYLPQQAALKGPSVPSMPLAQMQRALMVLISTMVQGPAAT